MKHIKLLTSLLVIFTITACTPKKEANNTDINTLKQINMMEINEISSMDSSQALDGGSFIAITQVMEGLYNLDDNDQVIPGVAKDMPIISDDGLKYTINLREDSKWSNGTPVTAHDFVYAWQRVIDPKNASPSHFLLFDINNAQDIFSSKKPVEELGVIALDDYTLEITLEEPVPYFTSFLTFPTLFPLNESYVTEKGESYASSSNDLIFNGPFMLSDWQPNKQEWVYLKNPNYWDNNKTNLDQVNIQVIKDNSLAYNLYEDKKLDRAVLSGELAKQEKDNPDYTTQLDSWVHILELNQQGPLADKHLREVIENSIDRTYITDDLLDDGSLSIRGLVPYNFVKSPKDNIDFRELSGDIIPKTTDSIADNEKITLTLLCTDSDDSKKIAQAIQNMIESNNNFIKIDIVSLPEKNALERKANKDFDLFLTRQGPDFQDPTTFLNKYKSDSFDNSAGYSSVIFDDLMKKAQSEVNNNDDRYETLAQAENFLISDIGVIPLYQSANTALLRPNITNMTHHLFGPPNFYGNIILK